MRDPFSPHSLVRSRKLAFKEEKTTNPARILGSYISISRGVTLRLALRSRQWGCNWITGRSTRSTNSFNYDDDEDDAASTTFPAGKSCTSTCDRAFSPSDREARNITSRTCGIPRLPRQDSITLSMSRLRAYFATFHGRVYLSRDQQCWPFSSSRTRIHARKATTRENQVQPL